MKNRNKIRDLRKMFGLSQKRLAELVHVDQTAVSQWETGKTYPNTETAIFLSKIFGVSTDYLLGKDDDSAPPKEDQEVWELRDALHKRPELKMLFDATKSVSKEDIEKAVKIIEALKPSQED